MKNLIQETIATIGIIGFIALFIGFVLAIWIGFVGVQIALTGLVVALFCYAIGKALEEV